MSLPINWDSVAEAIASEGSSAYGFDLHQAVDMVVEASEIWLPDDLREYARHSAIIEQEFRFTDKYLWPRSTPPLVGFMDAAFVGHPTTTIVDWKTRLEGELDDRWARRYQYSEQPIIYAASLYDVLPTGVERVQIEFRGITPKAHKTLTFSVDVMEAREALARQYGACMVSIDALNNITLDHWPRNMPDSCFAYGNECPFFKICRFEQQPPAHRIEIDHLSHSSLGTFLACPERFRLKNVLTPGDDSGPAAAFGRAFHRGIASVYQQSFALAKKDIDSFT